MAPKNIFRQYEGLFEATYAGFDPDSDKITVKISEIWNPASLKPDYQSISSCKPVRAVTHKGVTNRQAPAPQINNKKHHTL
jgi:hypothetical protein